MNWMKTLKKWLKKWDYNDLINDNIDLAVRSPLYGVLVLPSSIITYGKPGTL